MEQPSFDKTTVEHQYDTLIKKVLIGEAKNARAELKKRRAYEVNFSNTPPRRSLIYANRTSKGA